RRNDDDIKSRLIHLFKPKTEEEKKKGRFWPLQDMSFEGYQGEILGIIGSNGAGKTTLSKVVTGIIQNDRGDLMVDGKVTALFSFGMGFNKELTGRDNIYLNGMMLGIDRQLINDYIEDIHEFSELGDFIDQPMKFYSSGMRARLGFSVAAHLQPEILILDEALNTGDAKFGRKAAEKMKELVMNAKMVIIVTHSLRYAQRNCDRLIWLHKGEVKEIGDPKTVVANYRATVPKPVKKKQSLELSKTKTTIKDRVAIQAKDLGLAYDLGKGKKHWALKGLDFTIYEGEVVGIIGHNGAGKSTLCKVLTKILQPDQGEIEVNGATSSLLGYGTGFNPQLTGTDNIYLNGMLLGIPKHIIDSKYEEIVEFSGVRRVIDRPMKNYSSGMRARLGFSIAAVLQPDVFIIDEALSTGDLSFRQRATERIQEMIDYAKAVVIVSHSMNFVENVCTRAIWIEQGKIVFDGDAQTAVAKYREAMGAPKKKKRVVKKKRKVVKKNTTNKN
ncbi:MAG TPA: ATP-binding cassette domain-containing protein, partial [Pseudogracilibacillus sp.]|nr:ATP-binding cassette domain-containing protein [Pseudogracilibacillus sp.]